MPEITTYISRNRIVWFLLLLILLSTGFARYGLIDVPLERDEGEYAYAGQLILQGVSPYKQVYNMKFPGVYFAYAMILSIFGQTHQNIHLALLFINTISIILIFLLANKILNSFGAIFSTASFAILSLSQSVQGMFANAEHFVVVFVLGGVYFLLIAMEHGERHKFYISGLLLGIGVTMKQHGFMFLIFGILYIAYDLINQKSFQVRVLFPRLFFFLLGSITIFAALCLWIIWSGVFEAFWFWTIEYATAYIGEVSIKDALVLFSDRFSTIFGSAPLLWTIAGFGFSLLLFLKKKSQKLFLSLFTICSFLSICPGFYFRAHYFILLLPCVSLLAGMAVNFLVDCLSGHRSRLLQYGLPTFLVLICLGQALGKQYDLLFHMNPFQISRSVYGLNPFPESIKIADYLRKHSNPDDQIAILGSEPQILFYAKRKSISGHIYMYPLMEKHDFAEEMRKNFIQDIEEKNPRYLILVNISYSWLGNTNSQLEIQKWFMNYRRNTSLIPVGVVELFHNKSHYTWGADIRWPVNSKNWIVIFERKKD
jgi:hypothetical protein